MRLLNWRLSDWYVDEEVYHYDEHGAVSCQRRTDLGKALDGLPSELSGGRSDTIAKSEATILRVTPGNRIG